MRATDQTVVLAIDAGTTGVRTLAVDPSGSVTDVAYRELTQYFPRPGWVEHDAAEIWRHVADTLVEVARHAQDEGRQIAAIGITNQRETVVAWDRRTGAPLHQAIVWQDRRTAARCDELRGAGHLEVVRARTGLVLDPYFSATKMAWLLETGAVEPSEHLALGTVDAWVTWNLTGGASAHDPGARAEAAFVTDATNASRTLLYDIGERRWSDELCDLFGVPALALPEVRPSCGRLGVVGGDLAGEPALRGTAVSGVAGDQQAALFGQACFDPGMAKVTYGTGSFLLLNVGGVCPAPAEGLLTTVAWDLGAHAGAGRDPFAYALEGAIFSTGAAIQWLRDGLGIIGEAAEIGPLAASVPSSDGVYMVPAFAGLGSPDWDPYARGAVVGLTRGSGRSQLARAVVEAIAYQVRDVVDAMASSAGTSPAELRVDGGAAVMDLLLELQADQLQVPVARPVTTESTALGAANLAGLAEGVWGSLDDLASAWREETRRVPGMGPEIPDALHVGWRRAVERAAGWAGPADAVP